MNMILQTLAGMSISAAAVILLVIALRKLFFKKLPKRVMAALWLLPAAKLLIPFNALLCRTCSEESTVFYDGGSAVFTVTCFSVPVLPQLPALSAELPRWLGYIWLLGAVLIAGLYIFGSVKIRKKFACSLPLEYDASELKTAFGIRRKISLRTSELADSPFTYGVIRPVVILPKNTEQEQIYGILCHELAHIKRLDMLFKPMLYLCAAVHWFNPSVWVMAALAGRDMELACDEAAVSRGSASPEEYALTLIGMAERRCMLNAGFAGGSLEERITEIMTRGSKKRGIIPAVFALCAVACGTACINVPIDSGADISYTEMTAVTKAVESIMISSDEILTVREEAVYASEGDTACSMCIAYDDDSAEIFRV